MNDPSIQKKWFEIIYDTLFSELSIDSAYFYHEITLTFDLPVVFVHNARVMNWQQICKQVLK